MIEVAFFFFSSLTPNRAHSLVSIVDSRSGLVTRYGSTNPTSSLTLNMVFHVHGFPTNLIFISVIVCTLNGVQSYSLFNMSSKTYIVDEGLVWDVRIIVEFFELVLNTPLS